VLAEAAKELDRKDQLRPVMRAVLEQARKDSSLLDEFFCGTDSASVTDPSAEAFEVVHIYFDIGVELYERLQLGACNSLSLSEQSPT
jgi:hypothetical protein